MNLLDLAFIAGCALAAFGGWRLGFIRRVTGWLGLLLGIAVVSRVMPNFVKSPAQPTASDLLKSMAIIVAGGIAGQAAGHFVGGSIRKRISEPTAGTVDSAAGSFVGIVGIVVAAWMIIPAMVQIPGWPAEAARS